MLISRYTIPLLTPYPVSCHNITIPYYLLTPFATGVLYLKRTGYITKPTRYHHYGHPHRSNRRTIQRGRGPYERTRDTSTHIRYMTSFLILAGILALAVIIAAFIELSPKHDTDLPDFTDVQ